MGGVAATSALEFVFGYGSLVSAARGLHDYVLTGYRRRWNVAMDNRCTIAGYKYYVDATSGERPPVFVAFLNITAAPEGVVNGVLIPRSAGTLADLDRRERNYRRVEVTSGIRPAPPRRVFAYVGTAAGRARYRRAAHRARCVIARQYHEQVLGGFAGAGPSALQQYLDSTDAPACPLRALRRIDVAPAVDRPLSPARRRVE